MKHKTFFVLFIIVLIAVMTVGCASGTEDTTETKKEEETAEKEEEKEKEEPTADEKKETALDEEALMDIAIADANADSVNCENIKVAFKADDSETATVTFGYKGLNYTYVIDKFSGQILERNEEVGDPSQAVRMDVNDLFEIVFDTSDMNAGDMENLHLAEDGDNAVITFVVDGKNYKYVLNAYTGEILEKETP